ncbi:MAG TPA: aldolase/citrate lyase family protein [Candidatus Limnocylindrales bacterium]|nr:aldolase/citrate lyase family protein [Candidatus Limnocylindrales bacterium]
MPVDPPPSSFRARVLSRETLIGTFVSGGSPAFAEICAAAGFDWVVIDLEHGYGTEGDLAAQLDAVAGRSFAVVRPQSGERLRIGRALDLGAPGIMVPRLDTPEEVTEAVTYLRYPPDGVRGVALMTRGGGLGTVSHDGVAGLNRSIVGVVQIESPVAVRNAAAIAAIDGVDVLFVGPSDLSHSMGIPGRLDEPAFDEALQAVVRGAESAGKAAGILLRTGADLDRYVELGYRFIGIGSDLNFAGDGARAVVADARSR